MDDFDRGIVLFLITISLFVGMFALDKAYKLDAQINPPRVVCK